MTHSNRYGKKSQCQRFEKAAVSYRGHPLKFVGKTVILLSGQNAIVH